MARKISILMTVTAALALFAAPASAQKSKDTLRMTINDMFSVLDPYHFPLDEAAQFYRTVYETLVAYDERKKKYVPRLAKSWKRIDSRTLEFELRDDVTFHNGNKFDADDVKHTIDYIRDPKVKIRFKGRYSWVERVDKLGPYKVRIVGKKPMATDLSTIAYRFFIYDAETHAKLADKASYGRVSPVATGPYKVVSIDPHGGLVLERWDRYYEKSGNFRAPIKRVHGIPISDRQTQIAKFLAGELELMRNVTADTARALASMPGAKVTPVNSGLLMYVTLDAAGRSSNKAMTDQRVRKAFMMAVDRKLLAKTVIPGGEKATLLKAVCIPSNVGCSVTTSPPAFNPAEAKRLLADAGYGNGVDLVLNIHAPIKEIGEAIAGQVRKVGFRTTIRTLPLSLYVKLRARGEFTAFNGFYPTSAQPDVGNVFNFFFAGTRDYWKDPLIQKARKAGLVEFDEAKREKLYRDALDRVNRMNYILPVAELPLVWAHTANVRIGDNPLSPIESRLGDFFWK